MHYYKRNIGDYAKKAGRLSMLEHGSYTLLLDACYDRERFPTLEEAIDWTWARTEEEIAAVKFVLSKFFEKDGDIYVQSRIKEEIDAYRERAEKNAQIARNREANRANTQRTVHESCTEREPDVNESPPNHKPLTINHEKEKKRSLSGKPDIATEILSHLNEKTGKAFKPVDSNLRLIHARLKEGHSQADILGVIDRKVQEWGGTDMAQYLRPETLFGATKFNQYVGELPVPSTAIPPWHESWSWIVNKGGEHGIFEKDYQTPPDFKAAVFKAEGLSLARDRAGKPGHIAGFIGGAQKS